MKKLLSSALLIGLTLAGPIAAANPVGDFFKKIGRSLSKLHKNPPPRPTPHKKRSTGEKTAETPGEPTAGSPAGPSAEFTPSPSPTPIDIRPAALAPRTKGRRDVPYGVAVPNKPGFVSSPYAPTQGYVDVRAFPSSTEVLDPFTGKIFLTP